MKQYTKADEKFAKTVAYLFELSSKAAGLFQISKVDQKRQLINLVLSNLRLEGKKLLFEVKDPFQAIINANKNSKWLPGPDAVRTWFGGFVEHDILLI